MARQTDGSYLVGTYYDIVALLHDPRLSSDRRNRAAPYRGLPAEEQQPLPPFVQLDDPEHHRLRGLAMRPFGPPHSPGRIDAMRDEITRITGELIEALQGRTRIDIVDDFAYPLPVTRHLPTARRSTRGRAGIPRVVRRDHRLRRHQARR